MDARFDFGRNWSELAAKFEERHVEQAASDLTRLLGDIRGKSFLDIGCGSGLHSAAALTLGAKSVVAVDYDTTCVATAEAVLTRFASGQDWQVSRADALKPETLPKGNFDIVYSWGVLHHTGDMWSAVRNAAAEVRDGGTFCVALYLKTPMCGAWTVEKRLYSSQKWLRPLIRGPYVAAFLLAKTIKTGNAAAYVRDYKQHRGMEFMADVDDWLGGYPYESVAPAEIVKFVEALGFKLRDNFHTEAGSGLFGTRCGEWVFSRVSNGT